MTDCGVPAGKPAGTRTLDGRVQGVRGGWLERARRDVRRPDGAGHRGRDRAVARRRRGRPGMRVLDVGCGPGALPPQRPPAVPAWSASIWPRACSPRPPAPSVDRVRPRRRGVAPLRRRHLRRRARRLPRQPPPGRRDGDRRDAARRRARRARRLGPRGRGRVPRAAVPRRRYAGPGDPVGPSGERYADRERLAALVGGTVSEVRTTLHVDTLDELWDGIRGGTVRTAARLEAASTESASAPAPNSPASPSRTAPRGLRPPAHDPRRRPFAGTARARVFSSTRSLKTGSRRRPSRRPLR